MRKVINICKIKTPCRNKGISKTQTAMKKTKFMPYLTIY